MKLFALFGKDNHMSKIGRKPIAVDNAKVEVKGQQVHYKGKFSSGVHELPEFIKIDFDGSFVKLTLLETENNNNKFWGLHRALLANKIKGSNELFEKKVQIVGLGFKAELLGKTKVKFSLGFSHKIEKPLPEIVSLEIDKTGQILTFKSSDKEVLGQVCATIRALRPPEPYKGTGIKFVGEVIRRKAGKTKAAV